MGVVDLGRTLLEKLDGAAWGELWQQVAQGAAVNLGEILPGENGREKIEVTTDLQAFGLIVTAGIAGTPSA